MARYYEENALIEFVKQYTPTINGETTMECVERAIREAPTADVVPKSGVEEAVEKLMSATDKVICEAKQEVAREIFEEIERTLPNEFPFLGTAVAVYLAELKKKYTKEGENTI